MPDAYSDSYDRRRASAIATLNGLFAATLVVSIIIGVVAGALAWRRDVVIAQERAAQIQAQELNEFWHVLAGTQTSDDPVERAFARDLRPAFESPNPAGAMLRTYVRRGQYPGLENRLGIDLLENEISVEGSYSQELDQGYLDPEFVAYAVQATPENVGDLMRPLPPVQPVGLLSWRNAILASLIVPALGLLVQVVGHVRLKIMDRRHRRREEASRTPLLNEVLRIRHDLELLPRTPAVEAALCKADEAERVARENPEAMREVDIQSVAVQAERMLDEILAGATEGLESHRRRSIV